jgi:HK97 family phage prohead protease
MMQTFDFPLEVKDVGDDGVIEGFAAAYGNIDHGGDVILPGAFTKTLRGRKTLPMLLYHDNRRPVGVWTGFEDGSKGLKLSGRITTSTADGTEALALVRDGAIAGLSIGYRAVKERWTDAARELIELTLLETSLVAVPMNDRAQVTKVKTIAGDGHLPSLPEFEALLREAGFSRTQATAVAGKGLSHLLRGEPGDATGGDYVSALRAGLSA